MTRAIMLSKQFSGLEIASPLAHIFEGGCAGAPFKGLAKDEQNIFAEFSPDDDFYVFYYKGTAVSLVYDLKRHECGLHKAWPGVLLEKEN